MRTFLLVLLLAGCSTASDRIGDVRAAAEDCPGKVVLQVTIKNDDETIRFKCTWDASDQDDEEEL